MKKQTIWILTVLMALTFIGLLCMQIFYMRNMVAMRNDQFTQGVKQSLFKVAMKLEQDETRHYLEDDVNQIESSTTFAQYFGDPVPKLNGIKYTFTTSTGLEADLTITGGISQLTKLQDANSPLVERYRNAGDAFRSQYLHQKGMLDEVILNIISSASDRPVSERADSSTVRNYLATELKSQGLNAPFEFSIVNNIGEVQYQTGAYSDVMEVDNNDDSPSMFVQVLFPNEYSGKPYYLKVFFPTKSDYIFSSISFMVPSFAFTFILLIIFVVTIIVAFRQKRLSEMKNDFINNMTHEFKTPISSISLAAQMLNDSAVRKSPAMLQQISTVINDETKRLRFQVEKVLQMSMFDRQHSTLKLTEADLNAIIFNIINTFKLKVEKYGGKIHANLDAEDAIATVDEFHFTNVIFNLLDNAVKYRKEDEPLHLTVSSKDISDHRIRIEIVDNGIGIRKDDLKKIFEKFYRVSTGNLHDVKGFGLGLAYVKKMVTELGGSITAESEIGVGTKFIIILPLSKN